MATSEFTVSLQEIFDEFHLELIYTKNDLDQILISSTDVNRPGLQLVGFFDYFDVDRIQLLGKVEYTFLQGLDQPTRANSMDQLFASGIPAVIVTRNQEIYPEVLEAAKRHEVPLLRTAENTSDFMAALIAYLNNMLAPRVTRHGVLVEIYGEGVLMLGESGVGKSETAIELVKRGHRLVADDAVEIKRVSAKTLVGSAPDIIRHFIELRGIGIIDVKQIFGMGAVKDTEKIDLVVQLEPWDEKKHYDRLGLEDEYIDILGNRITSVTIPVRPGRNLAIILEVATMNHRQKRMGYNAAQSLNQRLMEGLDK